MKSQIWSVIIISLVVAAIVSIATASITGNIIRQNNNPIGRYEVYTKKEVDILLSAKTTNANVLNMLDTKCSIWSVAVPDPLRQVTGDDICKERNAGTCILMVNYDRFTSNDMIQRCTPSVTGPSDKTVAYCCNS